jgi:spore germination protein GerM
MLKFFTNLIFIIMLFFFLSGMPMNMEILDINPFQPVIETPTITEKPVQFTLDDSIEIDPVNPQRMTFDILASDIAQPTDSFLNTIQVTINSPAKSPAVLKLSELNYTISATDDPLKTSIVINLGEIPNALSPGYYQVDASSSETVKATANFSVLNFDKTYLTTSDSEQSGRLSMTLYFPTDDYKHLVPISTRVAYPENRSRTLFKALHAGPTEMLGLLPGPTIPYASRIYISNGVASIYIYSPEQIGYEDRFERATESIINSMTSLPFISSVKFYIDNKDDDAFGNVDLKALYEPTKSNVAYLNYSLNSDYSMMLPISVDAFEISDDSAYQRMLTILKGALPLDDQAMTDGLSPSVPAQVSLLGTDLAEDGNLTLDFSDAFESCFDSLSDEVASSAAQRMIDSIIYSYCSLENVQTLRIIVNHQTIDDFYGIDISEPFAQPLYINMDPSLS